MPERLWPSLGLVSDYLLPQQEAQRRVDMARAKRKVQEEKKKADEAKKT